MSDRFTPPNITQQNFDLPFPASSPEPGSTCTPEHKMHPHLPRLRASQGLTKYPPKPQLTSAYPSSLSPHLHHHSISLTCRERALAQLSTHAIPPCLPPQATSPVPGKHLLSLLLPLFFSATLQGTTARKLAGKQPVCAHTASQLKS